MVVGLALEVGADDGGRGLQCTTYVDDGFEDVVFDVDQLERVTRGIAVLGDDERHLLALEPHLVGGQDRLHVVGQRGHPGEVQRGEGLAGDDGLDLGVGLGGGDVDADDAGVRDGRAQDREVQHARQLDVVDVVALAAHEARVFLAQHPAVADRLLVVVLELADRTVLDGGHAGLPAASVLVAAAAAALPTARSLSAAHWMERTMVA